MKKDNVSQTEKVLHFPKESSKKTFPRFLIYVVVVIILLWIISLCFSSAQFDSTNAVNEEIISLSNSNTYAFSKYKDGFILAKDGKISCYNTNQQLQWDFSGSKTEPEIKTNGDWAIIYYPDASLAVVTNGSKTNRIKTQGDIIYGYTNSNGYCVLLTEESGLKNKISVYNKKGELIYYRDNPDKHIFYTLLSDNNKSLVTAELITDADTISSEFVVTNIRKNKITANVKFDGEIPAGCVLTEKNKIVALFETKMQCYTLGGKLKWQKDFENQRVFKHSYDDGVFALVFNEDDSENTGAKVEFYNKNARKVGEFKTEEKIRFVDLCDKTVLLSQNRKLFVANSKGKSIFNTDMTYDIKNVIFLKNKRCALVISNAQDARLVPLYK